MCILFVYIVKKLLLIMVGFKKKFGRGVGG